MNEEKPPLGLLPRNIWEINRLIDIKETIQRYIRANKPIPVDWIEEYNELQNIYGNKSC